MTVIIRIERLCKSFGGIVVADNFSLDISAGEILGLIGPNGAGKTSLFNLISGIYPADSGAIYLHDKALTHLSMAQRSRSGISRTWQNMRLFSTMSVIENLLVATRLYQGERLFSVLFHLKELKKIDEASREKGFQILKRMNLESLMDASITDLTFGPQKLMGLARALMHDGSCLLLDEPMAGVEGAAYELMGDIVREQAQLGRAVCVVEHNISFVKHLCKTAVFMANGKILERGNIDQLLASQTLETLYFGGQRS
ncbi:MAG: ABC transporter ATP-binding protein [Burkholderiaceae bacterium]